MNLGFVRTLSMGIDGTIGIKRFSGTSGSVRVEFSSPDNYAGQPSGYSINHYSSPDFALGIRFAVGLWPDIKSRR